MESGKSAKIAGEDFSRNQKTQKSFSAAQKFAGAVESREHTAVLCIATSVPQNSPILTAINSRLCR
jgi:hypothetical protein